MSHVPLSEPAEATGLDPTTAEAAMRQLEAASPYIVDHQDLEYSELQRHVRGSASKVTCWEDVDVWNGRD